MNTKYKMHIINSWKTIIIAYLAFNFFGKKTKLNFPDDVNVHGKDMQVTVQGEPKYPTSTDDLANDVVERDCTGRVEGQ